MSDMAPNMSGMKAIDQPKSIYLVELAMDFALQTLAKTGAFLTKVFQGEGYDGLVKDMRARFLSVHTRKPDASRARSREIYLLGKGIR
jgi:23S rRNA (uridine2552-2'-O)-methyltransferase